MKVTIQPSSLGGIITVPPSKSSMQRACAAALLTKGKSIIQNPGISSDDKSILKVIEDLGAKVKIENEILEIESYGVFPVTSSIDCGESGLGLRMFTPIIALCKKEIIINGKGSLLNRPMDFFDEVLPQLGVSITSNDGKLPVKIKGPLVPEDIEVDGSVSSQFLTGLLMAYAAALPNSSYAGSTPGNWDIESISIKVNNLKSKPYIDLTLDVMKKFGLNVPKNRNYKEFRFSTTPTNKLTNQPINYTVEGDWSGGAFLLVAGAIAGSITITGLDLTSKQADRNIIDAMMSANAAIAIEAKGIKVHQGGLRGFDFDATDCPDLFPPLVALAAYCDGASKIKGIERLVHKESNRAVTLLEEFGLMGLKIELSDDYMVIPGNQKIFGANIHSRHDHRIVMACAVAALQADGETVIEEAQAINKSYPDFFWHLKKLGAGVSLPFKKYMDE